MPPGLQRVEVTSVITCGEPQHPYVTLGADLYGDPHFGSGAQFPNAFGSGAQFPNAFGSGAQFPNAIGSGAQFPNAIGSGSQLARAVGADPEADALASVRVNLVFARSFAVSNSRVYSVWEPMPPGQCLRVPRVQPGCHSLRVTVARPGGALYNQDVDEACLVGVHVGDGQGSAGAHVRDGQGSAGAHVRDGQGSAGAHVTDQDQDQGRYQDPGAWDWDRDRDEMQVTLQLSCLLTVLPGDVLRVSMPTRPAEAQQACAWLCRGEGHRATSSAQVIDILEVRISAPRGWGRELVGVLLPGAVVINTSTQNAIALRCTHAIW
jgi:hypothetical protein